MNTGYLQSSLAVTVFMKLREKKKKKKKGEQKNQVSSCLWSSKITAWKKKNTTFTSFITDGQKKACHELFLIMAIECFKVEK